MFYFQEKKVYFTGAWRTKQTYIVTHLGRAHVLLLYSFKILHFHTLQARAQTGALLKVVLIKVLKSSDSVKEVSALSVNMWILDKIYTRL